MSISITLRLDRWASDLRNRHDPLDDDELMELSTLLTEAANDIASRPPFPVFHCPKCHLDMSRMAVVEVSDHWSEWRCWDCHLVFGGLSDEGSLDIGVTERLKPNPGV